MGVTYFYLKYMDRNVWKKYQFDIIMRALFKFEFLLFRPYINFSIKMDDKIIG